MLQESGRIVDIKFINGNKTAVIECISKSSCKSCSSNDSCGIGVVAKGLTDKSHRLTLPFQDGMEINETIELFIENKNIVKSSLIVYIIPLFFFILGVVCSYLITNNEPLVILISILSLSVGVYVAKIASTKLYPSETLNSLISTK